MPNPSIFCNSPWYDLHIYWDGSFGICCQESTKLYPENHSEYNIASMSIAEWFSSEPVRKFRKDIQGDSKLAICSRCYQDESYGAVSRRIRNNQKSVIFQQAFDDSFVQSPGYKHFAKSQEDGSYTGLPIDLHIDLGNYCNLACKMCSASASSLIAQQEVKWGIADSRKYVGTDWTRDSRVWDKFKLELVGIENLRNIHFMGGETLLTKRFDDLVETLIAANRTDVCLSFVSNGTTFNPDLLKKLALFKRVGIEVSIETVDEHNDYIRQGTNTAVVLDNIDKYLDFCNQTSITVTLRPAPSILSVGYMRPLLEYALQRKLVIKSNTCYRPAFMRITNLPYDVRQEYLKDYQEFLSELPSTDTAAIYNASDPNNYVSTIRDLAASLVEMLSVEDQPTRVPLLGELVHHCQIWDKVYGLNALELYPEWQFLREFGYDVPS